MKALMIRALLVQHVPQRRQGAELLRLHGIEKVVQRQLDEHLPQPARRKVGGEPH